MKKSLISFSAVLVLCFLCAAQTLRAADSYFVGVLATAVDKDVAAKLGLSPEKLAELQALVDERENGPPAIELNAATKGLDPFEVEGMVEDYRRETEKKGLALLDEAQRAKLEQIRLQKAGYEALLEPAVAEAVKLTDTQKADLTAVLKKRDEEMDKTTDEKERAKIKNVYESKLSAILSKPEQKEAWKTLSGSPGGGAPAFAGPGPGGPGSDSSKSGSGNSGRSGSVGGRPGRTGDSTAGTTPGGSGSKPADAKPSSKPDPNSIKVVDGLLHFNCRFQPWPDAISWFANQAELALFAEEFPQGTFNYQDTKGYTPAEAIDLLSSFLQPKGFALVRRDNTLTLLNVAQNGIPFGLVPEVSPAELDKRGKSELLRVTFRLNKMTPEDAEPEIKKMLSPEGTVVVLSKTGSLVVTDTAARLKNVREALATMDGTELLAQYEIKKAQPTELLGMFRQLLGIGSDKFATSDGNLKFTVAPDSRTIYMSGKSDAIAKAKEILQQIDVRDPRGPQDPQFEVYSTGPVDPDSVVSVLQTALAGIPGVRLAKDPKTGNIMVMGSVSAQATVRGILSSMLKDVRGFEAFHLRVVDPQAAAMQLAKLFAGESESTAPKIEAEPASRVILVRGSETQIKAVRELLIKMGENFDNADAAGEFVHGNGNVRFLQGISGSAARNVVEQAAELWPVLHVNKVRVVTPASTIPSVRTNSDSVPQPQPAPRAAPQSSPTSATPQKTPPAEKAPPVERTPIEIHSLQDTTTQTAPSKVRFVFVKQPNTPADRKTPALAAVEKQTIAPGGEKAAGDGEKVADDKLFPAAPAKKAAAGDAGPKAGAAAKPDEQEGNVPGAPIVVTVGPTGIIIASQDIEALDQFEELIRRLSATTGSQPYTVFYLKYARADVAALLLEQVFGGGTSSSSGGGGSLVGDIASAALGGGDGGGLVGSLLGLGGGGGGGGTKVVLAGGMQIVPDPRLNALIVQAKPADLDTIEQLLKVIDMDHSPIDIDVFPEPRLIHVTNTSAESVAVIVRQVYADRMVNPNQQQNNPLDVLAALSGGGRGGRGGRGGGGGGGRGGGSRDTGETKISIGVATPSNSLVVIAPDMIFKEIEDLVKKLDQAPTGAAQSMQVVRLTNTNAATLQRSLATIVGDGIQTTRVPATTTAQPPGGGFGFNQGTGGGNGGFGGGGLGGGGFGGGGFGGAGATGGGFGGLNQGGGFGGLNQGGGAGFQGGGGGFQGAQGGGGFGGGRGGGGQGGGGFGGGRGGGGQGGGGFGGGQGGGGRGGRGG